MPLVDGQSLSFYEILGPLGAGTMGVVYRARDTRLEREVAIKVLPELFAEDEERLRRFEREARALASLNHPEVAEVFGGLFLAVPDSVASAVLGRCTRSRPNLYAAARMGLAGRDRWANMDLEPWT